MAFPLHSSTHIINTESTNYFDKKLRRKLRRGCTRRGNLLEQLDISSVRTRADLGWPGHVCGWNYKNWKLGNILPRVKWSHASPGPMTAVKPRHAALLYVNIAGQNVCNAPTQPAPTGNATPPHSAYWGPGYILLVSDLTSRPDLWPRISDYCSAQLTRIRPPVQNPLPTMIVDCVFYTGGLTQGCHRLCHAQV